jgi:hypothetical protein
MRDLIPDEVNVQLESQGLRVLDEEDLAEIAHRINALRETIQALEMPDLDGQEPLNIYEDAEAQS